MCLNKKRILYQSYYFCYRIGRKIDSLLNKIFNNRYKKSLVFYPPVNRKEDLYYLTNTTAACFRERSSADFEVVIFASASLIDLNLEAIPTPKYQGNFKKKQQLRHLKVAKFSLIGLLKSDVIMIWDVRYLRNLLPFFYKTLLMDLNNHVDFDPLRGMSGWNYSVAYSDIISQKESDAIKSLSIKNYETFQEKKAENNGEVYVFASGPSFQRYRDFQYEKNSYKISINDTVRDLQFIQYVGLDAVCIKDPRTMGTSEYAFTYFEELLKNHKKHPFYIFVREEALPVLHFRYKQLHQYLIGVKFKTLDSYCTLTLNEMTLSTKPTGNSMIGFGLPLAASVGNKLFLLGADGFADKRDAKEFDFNEVRPLLPHSKKLFSPEVERTVFQNEPGYFRHRGKIDSTLDSGEDIYSRAIGMFIQHFEKRGKKIYTLHPSNYQSLKGRCVNKAAGMIKNN
jgi:hypothetical protein